MFLVVRTSCKTPRNSGGYKITTEEDGLATTVLAWGVSAISGIKFGLHLDKPFGFLVRIPYGARSADVSFMRQTRAYIDL